MIKIIKTNDFKLIRDIVNILKLKYSNIARDEVFDIYDGSTHVGYVTTYTVPPKTFCYLNILIFPEYHRRGLGRTVFNYMIENNLSNCSEIYTHIRKDDIETEKFLLSLGYEFVEDNIYKTLYSYNINRTEKRKVV
ncbi:MAG: GNAT family N-acetyltransferase [Peptostreptococcaceae bacterium]